MKRQSCKPMEPVAYPAFNEFHSNRNAFIRKLGIGALALAAAGCTVQKTGGVYPYPLPGEMVCPTPPPATNAPSEVIPTPPGGIMIPEEPPIALGGDIAMPEEVVQPPVILPPPEPPALGGVPAAPQEPEAQDK